MPPSNPILHSIKINNGIVVLDGQTFYTRSFLSRKFGKSYPSIRYYQKQKIIPQPTMIQITNGFIYLWSQEDLQTIHNNLKKISAGRYKKNKHPISHVPGTT